MHVRVAPRAQSRALKAALLLTCAVCAAWVAGCRSNPSDQITAEWMLDPSPPVAGGEIVAHVVLRDEAQKPIVGAKLHLEGQMSHPGMAPVGSDLIERGNGSYEARLKLTMAGDWVLVLTGEIPGGARITKQLELPGVRAEG